MDKNLSKLVGKLYKQYEGQLEIVGLLKKLPVITHEKTFIVPDAMQLEYNKNKAFPLVTGNALVICSDTGTFILQKEPDNVDWNPSAYSLFGGGYLPELPNGQPADQGLKAGARATGSIQFNVLGAEIDEVSVLIWLFLFYHQPSPLGKVNAAINLNDIQVILESTRLILNT